MTAYRRKLIEVAIPLDAINKASARKSPSVTAILPPCTYGGLGVRWRRAEPYCSRSWSTILPAILTSSDQRSRGDGAQEAVQDHQEVGDMGKLHREEVLECARAEIRKSCGGELPPVYDPFSGGARFLWKRNVLGYPPMAAISIPWLS